MTFLFSQDKTISSSGIDVTFSTFMEEVIEASKSQLVLVDFWAEWCGPCKQLTPVLEKVIAEENGAVKFVKVNADQNPELVQQFRIQSLPTVIIIKDGKPVSGFAGVTTASKLKALLAKLKGEEGSAFADLLEMAAEARSQGDLTTAFQLYAQILQQDPHVPDAALGLVAVYSETGDFEKARQLFEGLPDQIKSSPEARSLSALLDLKKETDSPAFQKNPASVKEAYALFLKGTHREAFESLLEAIRTSTGEEREGLKSALFKLFECLGQAHPMTIDMRKKLSRILF